MRIIFLSFILSSHLFAGTFLFDASKQEMSGNADWIIDSDAWDFYLEKYPCSVYDYESNPQYAPTPDQSTVTGSTPETYWSGGISAWGIDLVQAGHFVYTLPEGASITYGDGGNPYDLSNFDVFIVPEPQIVYTAGEITAILSYISNGGGLFMVADHQTSDRNCSGWDSPHVFNDLMGIVITGGTVTDYGLFGFVFNVEEISGLTSADYWFDDPIDDNVSTDPFDPVIQGPFGDGSGGLGFFGSTSMTLNSAYNPTVQGHVWKTDAGGQGDTRVTFVTAEYGAGRVAGIGDSSPADDGTGDTGDTLYDGWDKASGGVANDIIHLNACHWLLNPEPDVTPPLILTGPFAAPDSCTSEITWTTDEPATTRVDYGLTDTYGSSETVPGYRTSHAVTLTNLLPETTYHYQASSSDASSNGPTESPDDTFETTTDTLPVISSGPSVSNITDTGAVISWTTNEPGTSTVYYDTSPSLSNSKTDSFAVTSHAVTLTGLLPSTLYYYRVETTDTCGNPVQSSVDTFSTADTPPEIDISGWTLWQYDSTQSFTFPADTKIPGNGYLVLGRNADQASFEAEWGTLPAGVVYVNSGESCPMINGSESFELTDDLEATVDGVTIAMSAGTSIQRNNPTDPAGDPGSWTPVSSGSGTPGSGAGTPGGAGVVINEASDASSYPNEFVELYYDSGIPEPDTTPPDPVIDLSVEPTGSDTIRLTFTAPGDDGMTGRASYYDIRHSPVPIATEAGFASAVQVSGEPAPSDSGLGETIDVSGLVPDTTYFFALKTGDEVINWSILSNTSGTTTPSESGGEPPADHPVISEFQAQGASLANDEFIELYNPTDSAVALSGKSIQYKSATGSTFLVITLPSEEISVHGYYLVARPEYTLSVTPDMEHTVFLMGGAGGNLFLADTTSPLSSCSDPSVIDRVGYGTGNCPEGTAPAAHDAGESLERLPGSSSPGCGNGQDTDDNSADFIINAAPNPQNSTMTESPCGGSGVPGNVGRTLFITGPGPTQLSWGPAYGATSYRIRRHTSPESMLTQPVLDEVVLTSFSDNDSLPVGTCYFYFITAFGAGAESTN